MNVDHLLSNVDSLIQHTFLFEQTLDYPDGKSHKGISIRYVDLLERRADFVRELKNTVCNWVYSKSKYRALFDEELTKRNADPQNAGAHIDYLARNKFRRGSPQGQFGELLLFNFIQHYFKAAPLLRKMPLTTSTGHERFGADAIHYRFEDGKNIIFLGESKAYESTYQFNTAFKASITSIVHTFDTLQEELLLYVYDDFIEQDLQEIAKKFKEGTLENVNLDLVCLIAYNENINVSDENEDKIRDNIEAAIKQRFEKVDSKSFDGINDHLIKRIHYLVMPFWNFEKILEEFDS